MKSKKHIRSSSTQFEMLMLKFNWSMKMNALQKIFVKRCKQPLNDLKNHNNDRSIKRHVRHLSDQVDESMEQHKLIELLKHRRTPTDNFQKCDTSDITRIYSNRKREENSLFFQPDENTRINEQFLALFKDRKDQTIPILAPRTQVEQENLQKMLEYKKLNQNDLFTFIQLVKKPRIVVEEEKKSQLQSSVNFKLLIFLTLLLLIAITFI